MTTTAQYRTEALEAEKQLRWKDAALLWGKAMNAYPKRLAVGALYQKDMTNMLARAKSCVHAANAQEKGEM